MHGFCSTFVNNGRFRFELSVVIVRYLLVLVVIWPMLLSKMIDGRKWGLIDFILLPL